VWVKGKRSISIGVIPDSLLSAQIAYHRFRNLVLPWAVDAVHLLYDTLVVYLAAVLIAVAQQRGGGRSFSRDMVVDENGIASGKDRYAIRDPTGAYVAQQD